MYLFPLLIISVVLLAAFGARKQKTNSSLIPSFLKSESSDDDPFTGINNAGMPGNIWSDATDDLHNRPLRDD